MLQCMWIEQGTLWYSVCILNWELCGTVYEDRTKNRVVQCMWIERGTVWYSAYGLNREQCGTVYVV